MDIIGLTGSIGVGKSYVARFFKRLNIPVIDSDILSREVWQLPYIQQQLLQITPSALDREKLATEIFNNANIKKQIEDIIHPAVARMRHDILALYRRQNKKYVVIESPLLFEKKIDKECHKIIVVVSSKFQQIHRLTSKRNMSKNKINEIRKNQLEDIKKMQKADIVLYNNNLHSINSRVISQIIKIHNNIIIY
jgi:dephospho-CoA kinase